ncbi:MAG TPA: ATP synthase subunit I [Pseudogracilibacillus sp.]|nr:ATP synthase subunit I [Pseudogracilibacillus sp.]
MANYEKMVARQRKWLLYGIAIVAIVTFLVPYEDIMFGLLLGMAVSFYNLWLLQRKTRVLGESAAQSGKRTGMGTVSRFAMAALGALIAFHYDLSIIAFIFGLTLVYPIIMIDFLLFNRK